MMLSPSTRRIVSVAVLAVVVARAVSAQGRDDVDAAPRKVTVEKSVSSTVTTELPEAPVEITIPVEHHPWARFAIGCWRTMRTTTETFDGNGKFLLRSETLHTDTLTEVTGLTYTYNGTSVVDVGGKRLRGATQVVTRSLLSEHCETPPLVTKLPPADVSLSGRSIPCQRWELSIGDGPLRRLETVYYSPDVSPHFMRREISAADGSSSNDLTSTTTSLINVDVPILLEGGMIAGRQTLIQSTSGANTIERVELNCDAVPGGLVRSTATERDATGRRVRWVVSELEDFGQEGDPPKRERRWRLLLRGGR